MNTSRYYDAKSKSPPLASSPTKEPPPLKPPPEEKSEKKKKKVKRAESPSSADESLISSVSTQSLTSACNPEQMKKKAERRILNITKSLKQTDLSEESLKTIK